MDERIGIVDPDGGRTSYLHDAAGQLVRIDAPCVGRISLAYDFAGRTVGRHSSGLRVSHSHDAAGRQVVLASVDGVSAVVNRFSYSYDAGSRGG